MPFIDSTALAVFVRVFKRLRHEGAEIVLWAPTGQARNVLRISGLDRARFCSVVRPRAIDTWMSGMASPQPWCPKA
ncbi:MAG TPA: STAS domain-containing protein [Acidimicrobiia bacterium]|nr:STAS domain-containing protein [Acidimicrobiia bacterium]